MGQGIEKMWSAPPLPEKRVMYKVGLYKVGSLPVRNLSGDGATQNTKLNTDALRPDYQQSMRLQENQVDVVWGSEVVGLCYVPRH